MTVDCAAMMISKMEKTTWIRAVKLSGYFVSGSIREERKILTQLQDCSQIIHCYGDTVTFEDGFPIYNMLLEYTSGGSLHDRIVRSGGGGCRNRRLGATLAQSSEALVIFTSVALFMATSNMRTFCSCPAACLLIRGGVLSRLPISGSLRGLEKICSIGRMG
uniref:Uncharacterized protein n=1 Tax=Nelumbo nucifera TaxID=4432 RepID=A0A822XWY5_NELNU|nr:TPA_asm: hypothetical protein HUJ06_024738 [Nelumbo nucifera]